MKNGFVPQMKLPLGSPNRWVVSSTLAFALLLMTNLLQAAESCNIIPNFSTTPITCVGGSDGSASVAPTNGTAPYAVLWSTGATTTTISGLTAGMYDFTITDSDGCTELGTVCVNPIAPVVANVSRTNNACRFDTNGSLSLNPTGGTAPYTYQWSTGATSSSISGLAAGPYSYTITDANGCTKDGSVSVLANDPVIGSLTVRDNNCHGESMGSAFVTGSGGVAPYTYAWSNGATTQNNTGLAAGTYGYTITDSEGCTGSGEIAIQEPAPVWTTFTQRYACGGNDDGRAEVFANGGTPPYAYQWSNGATTPAIENLGPGMYGYTVTDAEGCQSAPGLVCIFRSTNESTVSSTDPVCAGDDSGSASITVTQGLPPYTYQWSNGATTADVSGLAPGMYSYTVTGQGGCTSSGAVVINNASGSAVSVSAVQQGNGNVLASASGGTAPYTYAWSNGETGATATMYNVGDTYTVTATDANGCTATASGVVTDTPDPCDNTTIVVSVSEQADGSLSTSISGNGTAPYTYAWSNGETGATATMYNPGDAYSVVVTDANGCTATASGTVSNPDPCENTTIVVSVTEQADGSLNTSISGNGTAPYTYAWSNGETGATATMYNPGDAYSVVVTDANGCTATASGTVSNPDPCENTTIMLSVSEQGDGSLVAFVSGNGTAPYTYAWSNGETGTSATMYGPGDAYSVVVTDANGCTATASGTVSNPDPCDGIMINVTVDQSDTGNLVATITGNGAAPYTYAWSNGETMPIATGYASNDDYSVVVTDANGCTGMATGTVTPPSCPGNIVFPGVIGNDQELCAPGVAPAMLMEIEAATGGVGPIEYLWMSTTIDGDFGSGIYSPIPNSNAPNYQPSPLTETTYFIRCVRREGCVYLESNTVTVVVGDEIDAMINRPALGCFGETQTYSVTNVPPGADISWSFAGAVEVSGTTGSSVDVTFVGGGFLNFSVTVTANGCTGVFSEEVTITTNCFGGGGDGNGTTGAGSWSAITQIYPNPVADRATLVFDNVVSPTDVLVYNTSQQLVASYTVDADTRQLDVDLSRQESGLFFIRVLNAEGLVETVKLVKR